MGLVVSCPLRAPENELQRPEIFGCMGPRSGDSLRLSRDLLRTLNDLEHESIEFLEIFVAFFWRKA